MEVVRLAVMIALLIAEFLENSDPWWKKFVPLLLVILDAKNIFVLLTELQSDSKNVKK